jgi:isopenicillin N synthase-like dioxygenase
MCGLHECSQLLLDRSSLTNASAPCVQAWSNNRYKSVEHKVVANAKAERFSAAYFLCPSYHAPVGTCGEPSPYRTFTFGEYRRKVQEDVKRTGRKIGLPNFLKQQPPQPQ